MNAFLLPCIFPCTWKFVGIRDKGSGGGPQRHCHPLLIGHCLLSADRADSNISFSDLKGIFFFCFCFHFFLRRIPSPFLYIIHFLNSPGAHTIHHHQFRGNTLIIVPFECVPEQNNCKVNYVLEDWKLSFPHSMASGYT